jgi:hypothetical protein
MQGHVRHDRQKATDAQVTPHETPATAVIGKWALLRDDALVTWWERALAGLAVALVLQFLFKVLHG